jgi:CelD/BcsL family acetyltransferase involved in cellulose biosynthesis
LELVDLSRRLTPSQRPDRLVVSEAHREAGGIAVTIGHSLEEVRGAWETLDSSGENPFTTYAWASTWWSHFGRGQPAIAVADDGAGAVRGILAGYVGRIGPARTLRLIGHGAGDRLGPAGDLRDTRLVGDTLAALAAAERAPWDVILAERLPRDLVPTDLPGVRVVRRAVTPIIDLGDTWETVLQGFSRRLRKEIRAKERAFEREHRVTFRRTEDPGRLDADFDTFLRLHEARWPDGRSSILSRAAFHRQFAREALRNGWLQLWFLEADGVPVAARYDFLMGSRWLAYNAGRDPAWDRSSVGLLLRAHTIREAIRGGARSYDLLRGHESYKGRLATRDEELLSIAVPRGPFGHAVLRLGAGVLSARRIGRLAGRALAR